MNYKHGLSTNPASRKAYLAWVSIRRRCLNPKAKNYPDYGGRGVALQGAWVDDSGAFTLYVVGLPGYVEGASLDRIDNAGHYEEGNLRWTSPARQVRNRRKFKKNSTGVTGVSLSTSPTGPVYVARWSGLDGARGRKSFSVSKYGLLPAFAMACSQRKEAIAQLNNCGAGYAPAHGL